MAEKKSFTVSIEGNKGNEIYTNVRSYSWVNNNNSSYFQLILEHDNGQLVTYLVNDFVAQRIAIQEN